MLEGKSPVASILFFTKTHIQWWNSGAAEVQNFEFPSETLIDLDIVNEELVQTSFLTWLQQSQQTPREVVIIFADELYFTKDFAATSNQDEIKTHTQEFCDVVPFDNLLCKPFTLESGLRIFAMNKGLYEIIVKTLEEQTYTIDNYFPQFLFPVDFSQGLTPENAKETLPVLSKLQDMGLMDPKQRKEAQQKKFIKKQFAITKEVGIALGVFVFLMAVLGVLIWNMQRQNAALENQVPSPLPEEIEVPVVAPVATPIASSSADVLTSTQSGTVSPLGSLRIQVLNGSGVSGKADEVKQNLVDSGAVQEFVVTGNAAQSNPGRTSVVVKPGLNSNIQVLLQEAFRESFSNFSYQENIELSAYDMIITIGASDLL